ncbi:MAG: DNA mismatch repair protein MutS [Bacteroidota bacterium]
MTKSGKVSETPLMKQYNAIKARYPGALLLFRVGDFYETFGEDAIRASKVLEIVLTKRSNGAASEMELAGFPHHSLDAYLPRLVRAGFRVAICDQLEDPKSVKGIVKRGVTELVTPGLSLHDNVLEQNKNNFLAAIHFGQQHCGLAFLDLSTGEFMVTQGNELYIDKLIQGFNPSEIIYCKTERNKFQEKYEANYHGFGLEEWIFQHPFTYERLIHHFNTTNLKGFGIEELKEGTIAAGAILYYLEETEHRQTGHIGQLSRIDEQQFVWMDKFTIRNLELLSPSQPDGKALIEVLDQTKTPMGARLLRKWLVLPLKDQKAVERRLDTVEGFLENEELLDFLLDHLSKIGDLERLISKVATRRINPREMNQLKNGLKHVQPIREELVKTTNNTYNTYTEQLNDCHLLLEQIESVLKDEVPLNSSQGNMIKEGVDTKLDDLRAIAYSGKDYLKGIQEREIERTGITSLKIAYNKVFGYYLEVTNSHKDKVPQDWIRKQTLVNAERYITEELKVYEEKILKAEDQIFEIESQLYQELISNALEYIDTIQQNAKILATIDCLSSFAYLAGKHNYVKPSISAGYHLDIKKGRHPVIEQNLPADTSYIPNDIFLDNDSQQIIVITGPNMAGKSALLRQSALITLMAQIGSFVPAGYAKIGLVDKIFTRVGASDNLSKGESTFMVEMTETASILNNLSDRSLILMDEIGRGTSTYDGISIAWSIVEYMHNHPHYKAKTLFATHYHELNELTNTLPRVKNFNVSVKELEDKVIFLRKLEPGGSEHSFGIHVAQMAGMPNQIVIRANEILKNLEKEKLSEQDKEKLAQIPSTRVQLNLFESDPKFEKVMKMLSGIDVNTISPVEALLKINEMKEILKGKNSD